MPFNGPKVIVIEVWSLPLQAQERKSQKDSLRHSFPSIPLFLCSQQTSLNIHGSNLGLRDHKYLNVNNSKGSFPHFGVQISPIWVPPSGAELPVREQHHRKSTTQPSDKVPTLEIEVNVS